MFWGGSPCNNVLKTFPTVWYILLHTALDCGFLAVVQTYLMWQFCNSVWNAGPVNSVLWQGVILHVEFVEQKSKQTNKQTNKQTTNMTCVFGLGLAWNLGLGSWLGILAWVLDLGPWLQTDMVFHELDLSMVLLAPLHILQRGIERASRSGRNLYPLPSSLFLWQKSQLRLSASRYRSLWYYLCFNCS